MPPSPTPDATLAARLRDRIRREGPIPFREFMSAALYDPDDGYYASGRARVGRQGDFFTSVSVGQAFGRLIGLQVRELWRLMGRPPVFDLVEQGAHDGQFLADLLHWAGSAAPELARSLRVTIIEPSAAWRSRQGTMIGEMALAVTGRPARWVDSAAALAPDSLCGLHFSNELADAFPVHLLRSSGIGWRELGVDWTKAGFCWREFEIADPALASAAEAIGPRPEGYTTEVCLEYGPWLADLARSLSAGFVLIADYGYPADVYYAPHCTEGTLACYRAHRRDADPLDSPGDKDITAHVNFTALASGARAAGFRVEGFTDQHHYLIGLAKPEFARIEAGPLDVPTRKYLRQLQALTHPGTMGMAFKFLLLSRGTAPGEFSGFALSPGLSLGQSLSHL